jgi:hypothetical protein
MHPQELEAVVPSLSVADVIRVVELCFFLTRAQFEVTLRGSQPNVLVVSAVLEQALGNVDQERHDAGRCVSDGFLKEFVAISTSGVVRQRVAPENCGKLALNARLFCGSGIC